MRKRLRLPNYDYSQNDAYFVTVCTHGRRPILTGDAAAVVESELFHIQGRYRLMLDYHVVMTDHIHAILLLSSGGVTLSQIVGAFKSRSTVELYRRELVSGKIWQRSFFDRIVRDEKELLRLRQYIQANPTAEALADGLFDKFQKDLDARHGAKGA